MDKDIVDEILSIEVTQFDGQLADLEELVSREKIIEIIKKYMQKIKCKKNGTPPRHL